MACVVTERSEVENVAVPLRVDVRGSERESTVLERHRYRLLPGRCRADHRGERHALSRHRRRVGRGDLNRRRCWRDDMGDARRPASVASVAAILGPEGVGACGEGGGQRRDARGVDGHATEGGGVDAECDRSGRGRPRRRAERRGERHPTVRTSTTSAMRERVTETPSRLTMCEREIRCRRSSPCLRRSR